MYLLVLYSKVLPSKNFNFNFHFNFFKLKMKNVFSGSPPPLNSSVKKCKKV